MQQKKGTTLPPNLEAIFTVLSDDNRLELKESDAPHT